MKPRDRAGRHGAPPPPPFIIPDTGCGGRLETKVDLWTDTSPLPTLPPVARIRAPVSRS